MTEIKTLGEKKRTYKYLLVLFLLGVYLLSSLFALKKLSPTYDEGAFFGYGIKILKDNPTKEDDIFRYHSKMPVCALNALPRAMEQLFHPSLKKSESQAFFDIYHGRFISVLIGLLTILYVFKWSKELYGFPAGCFSLFLSCLSPNLIAYSQFVSTDIYAAFFSIALFYHTWKYSRDQSLKQLILLAVFLALCEVSKQALLFYYFIIPLILIIVHYSNKKSRDSALNDKDHSFKNWIIWKILLVAAINLFIINAAFLFFKTGMPLNKYHFISQSFQDIQKSFSFIWNIYLPLPEPFLSGMDAAKYFEQLGGGFPQSSYPNVYLLGQAKQNGFFWYYYPVVLFFKLTTPFLIAIIIAIFNTIKIRRWNEFIKNEFFIIFPVITSLILFDLFYKAQIGIRHILFILPLLQVLCGMCLYTLPAKIKKYQLYFLVPFILWQFVSVMQYFPHFLPYTNEFILHKKNAYKFLADSNLSYNEGRNFVKDYIKMHPGVIYQPAGPTAGIIIVNINDYLDLWNTGNFNWLKKLHKEPSGDIDSGYLIFNVSDRDIKSLNQ